VAGTYQVAAIAYTSVFSIYHIVLKFQALTTVPPRLCTYCMSEQITRGRLPLPLVQLLNQLP
jgi:hypothetical protein